METEDRQEKDDENKREDEGGSVYLRKRNDAGDDEGDRKNRVKVGVVCSCNKPTQKKYIRSRYM